MEHFKKLFAILLISIFSISIFSSSISAISDTGADENLLNIVIPINDDIDFPVNIAFDYEKNSVKYSKSEVNSFNTPLLLEDELKYNILMTSKDSYTSFDIKIYDDNCMVYNSTNTSNEKISMGIIHFEKVYNFTIEYGLYEYSGIICIHPNGDEKIYFDVEYSKVITMEMRNMSVIQEKTTSNDKFSDAQIVKTGYTVKGKMDSKTDVDYYQFDYPLEYSGAQADVILSVPGNACLRVDVYGGDKHYLLGSYVPTNNGESAYLHVNLSIGNTQLSSIWVKVSRSTTYGTDTCVYYMSCNIRNVFPYYSQKSAVINGYPYWNSAYLDTLTFPKSANPNRPFYTSSLSDTDYMNEGCYITTFAMALRYENATMDGKDYRVGYKGALYADPFTVMLASNNLNGTELTSRKANSKIDGITGSPIYGNRLNISNNFDVTISYTELDNYTQKEKMNKIDALLASQGYVPVFLAHGTSDDNSYTHFMIIKGRNNNTDPNTRYIVLDPAGTSKEVASGVKFKDCPSYSSNPSSKSYKYNFDCVKMVYTIN